MIRIRKTAAALTAALLMTGLWTTPAAAGQPDGFLEGTDGHTVYGWAWDPDAADSAAEVQITVRNTDGGPLLLTRTCSAGLYREDLLHMGDGSHGFEAALELPPLPYGSYIIEASVRGAVLPGALYWQGSSYPIQSEKPVSADTASPVQPEDPAPADITYGPLGPLRTASAETAGESSDVLSAANAFSTEAAAAVSSGPLGTLTGAPASLSAAPAEPPAPSLIPLGIFHTTAYCSCRRCSGRWGRLTSSGAIAVSGHTVAVDPKVIPFGTKLMIGGTIYTAEDEGSGVNGRHIDIYCDTHAEAAAYGLQRREVYLVP